MLAVNSVSDFLFVFKPKKQQQKSRPSVFDKWWSFLRAVWLSSVQDATQVLKKAHSNVLNPVSEVLSVKPLKQFQSWSDLTEAQPHHFRVETVSSAAFFFCPVPFSVRWSLV